MVVSWIGVVSIFSYCRRCSCLQGRYWTKSAASMVETFKEFFRGRYELAGPVICRVLKYGAWRMNRTFCNVEVHISCCSFPVELVERYVAIWESATAFALLMESRMKPVSFALWVANNCSSWRSGAVGPIENLATLHQISAHDMIHMRPVGKESVI